MVPSSATRAEISSSAGKLDSFDDQRMVTCADHRLRQALEKRASVMCDSAGSAMHQPRGTHNGAAERRSNRLVTEADAKRGNLLFGGQRREVFDERNQDAGLPGCTGARGEEDAIRAHCDDLGRGDFIVSAHDDFGGRGALFKRRIHTQLA